MLLAAEGESWIREARVPIRLLLGSRDEVADPSYLEELARLYPHVSFVRVPGAGHDLPLTNPQLCLAELRGAAR